MKRIRTIIQSTPTCEIASVKYVYDNGDEY